ncbi:HAD family hydrolase [Candidatus Micrarchaeota archaeon]|nr:HAD family hydrolase [Candidatus Micrarchaeota archaeon]MBI5176563.1 HAD family hydrolase [Candidatus Micrarchaeota archaeon]
MLVLFDLDGTLLDSLEAWLRGYRSIIPGGVNLSDRKIIDDFFVHDDGNFRHYGISDIAAFYESLDDAVFRHADLITAFGHVQATMGRLKCAGHRLGVLTARRKAIAKRHCPKWLLEECEVFIDREDAAAKPAPDGILKACGMTGVKIADAVFVGDHPIDFQAARAAGVPFIFFMQPDGKFRRNFNPQGVRSFGNFAELPGIIEEIASTPMGKKRE